MIRSPTNKTNTDKKMHIFEYVATFCPKDQFQLFFQSILNRENINERNALKKSKKITELLRFNPENYALLSQMVSSYQNGDFGNFLYILGDQLTDEIKLIESTTISVFFKPVKLTS